MAGKFKFMGYKFVLDEAQSPGPYWAEGPIPDKDGKPQKGTHREGSLVWVDVYGAKGHFTGSTKIGGYLKRIEDQELLIEVGGQRLAFQRQKDPATGELAWIHLISQGKAKD